MDKYDGLGYPPPKINQCPGPCEGVGIYPLPWKVWCDLGPKRPAVIPQGKGNGMWDTFPPWDLTVWVSCPRCHGKGRRFGGRIGALLDLAGHAYFRMRFGPGSHQGV